MRGFRRRDVAGWLLALAASCVVGVGSAHGAGHWTVAKLVRQADGSAAACKVAPHWGPKQIRCSNRVVYRRDSPALERQAWSIQGCETGGTYDEGADDNPPYVGLGQFHPGTWATLPRWLSKHSPLSPPWAQRAMRYLRLHDGDWHQWPYCGRRF